MDSTDEIGRVARAFDQVHQEAVRLAGNEALLRGNVSAMFISLSRRSVPLIDRLTRMIDELEQNEDDPDRLSSLFAMDHLVTRMRRNSENLLVLAGEEPVRKWSEPVPLADVARAATSEIEQYGRIVLNIQPGIVVSGQAAADVVHLLAEIIENATMFSPRDTPVQLTGQEVSTGGVLLEVRDSRDRHPADPARRDELAVRQPAARRRVGVQAHGAVRGIPAGGAARGASPAAGGGAAGRVRPGLAARQPHRPGVAPVHRPAVAAAREGVVHRAGAWRPTARGPGRRRPAAAAHRPSASWTRTANCRTARCRRPRRPAEGRTGSAPSGRPAALSSFRRHRRHRRHRCPRRTATTPATWLAKRPCRRTTRPSSRSTRLARKAGRCPPGTAGTMAAGGSPRRCRRRRPAARRLPGCPRACQARTCSGGKTAAGRRAASLRAAWRPNSSRPRGGRRGSGRQNARAGASAGSSSAAAMPRPAH